MPTQPRDMMISETPKKQLKLCGNCRRVNFGLDKEEVQLLMETIKFYGPATMRNWLKKNGKIKMVGGSGALDPEKTRVLQLLKNHFKICPIEKVEITPIDEPCFAWMPQGSAPEDNHGIRQRVFQELQKNPSLGPKSLCETLALAWPQYQNHVKTLCTEYRRLMRNKGFLARRAR